MKRNLRHKIRDFLNSEDGAVGVKTPLALGVATSGLMLAQAILNPSTAAAGYEWANDADCPDGESCELERFS